MHKIFESTGTLRALTDFNGDPVKQDLTRKVFVEAKYWLKPSPQQPLILDIYGYELFSGAGNWTEQLELENGLTVQGSVRGKQSYGHKEPPRMRKLRMVDVTENQLHLNSTNKSIKERPTEIDSALFSVVNSAPLGQMGCRTGVARPGFPFSHRKEFPRNSRIAWSTQALRLHYRGIDIFFSATSNYWRNLVDESTLDHDLIVGVRRSDRQLLSWNEIDRVVYLIEQFIGWINHCSSSVYHIKAYRKGRFVYRGYQIYPVVTVQRERFSWFPRFAQKSSSEEPPTVCKLFELFVKKWEQNEQDKGTFHTVLGLLRGVQKGSPISNPVLGYLRDTFTACTILEAMLSEKSSKSGRSSQIKRCLDYLGVVDKLPHLNDAEFELLIQSHDQLWWSNRSKRVMIDKLGTLSIALANLQNWLLHLEDIDNVKRLFDLPWEVRNYLLEVSIWLADLMILRSIGYDGKYLNRMTGETHTVPWVESKCSGDASLRRKGKES